MTSANSDQVVGANIQRYRTLLSISQAQLAERMTQRGHAMQQQTILKIEKGARPLKFSEAVAMADCLKIEVQDLSEADEERSEDRAKLRRILGLCDEILMKAAQSNEKEDKLRVMLGTLRALVEENAVDLIGTAAATHPRVLFFANASAAEVRELARQMPGTQATIQEMAASAKERDKHIQQVIDASEQSRKMMTGRPPQPLDDLDFAMLDGTDHPGFEIPDVGDQQQRGTA